MNNIETLVKAVEKFDAVRGIIGNRNYHSLFLKVLKKLYQSLTSKCKEVAVNGTVVKAKFKNESHVIYISIIKQNNEKWSVGGEL